MFKNTGIRQAKFRIFIPRKIIPVIVIPPQLMAYKQFQPHPALRPYIDAYWMVRSDKMQAGTQKILPDGCVDIIINLGDDYGSDMIIRNERSYLVGTMTCFQEVPVPTSASLVGIRFKPAGFFAFYSYASLHEFTDQTIEFDAALSPDLKKLHRDPFIYLDHFFLGRLSQPRHLIFPVLADIRRFKGRISISDLARQHHTTTRNLERMFRQHIGTSPKAFANLERFQHSFERIRNNPAQLSLEDIAFEYGYYDHAHLANEIRKYTGLPPSSW